MQPQPGLTRGNRTSQRDDLAAIRRHVATISGSGSRNQTPHCVCRHTTSDRRGTAILSEWERQLVDSRTKASQPDTKSCPIPYRRRATQSRTDAGLVIAVDLLRRLNGDRKPLPSGRTPTRWPHRQTKRCSSLRTPRAQQPDEPVRAHSPCNHVRGADHPRLRPGDHQRSTRRRPARTLE